MIRHAVPAALLAASAAAQSTPAPSELPRTMPETSGYTVTSSAADVASFVAACTKLPHGDRLSMRSAGTSHAGREQLLVRIASPDAPAVPRLRALVIGNIHAGEIEGKEALQELLREFALGQHDDVLARCDVWFLPIHNVDGNEKTGTKNRAGQNGPDVAGERAN